MPLPGAPRPSAADSAAAFNRRSAVISQLAAAPRLEGLGWCGLRTVVGLRVLSLCGAAGRDPMLELTTRLRSVTQARLLMEFAELAGRCWPEPLLFARPCCCILTPDEATLATLAEAARRSDRAKFCSQLCGFVRADRHDAIYGAMQQLVAHVGTDCWRQG